MVTGVVTIAVLPSPKSQLKLVSVTPGTSVLMSVKVTVSGQQPGTGAAVKLATGLPTVI